VEESALARVCRSGLYVARPTRGAPYDAALPWSVRAQDLSAQPSMPPMTRALISARPASTGSIPWVATIAGLVAFGADATAVHTDEAGPWFPTGRGRHWVLGVPPLQE
jgi:hypothetical protein